MSGSTLTFGLLLSVIDKATAPLRTIGKGFDGLKESSERLQKAAEGFRVARENVDDFTNRAKAGLQSIMAPAIELEDQLADLGQSIKPSTGTATEALERVQKAAVEWSSAHKHSAVEFVAATKLMTAAHLDEAKAIAGAQTALRLATATHEDAAGVANTLAVVYGQMGDKTKDATAELSRLGDVLARAKQLFPQIKVGDLTDPLKDAIPAAQAAGVSVEQLIATIGTLNAAGVKGGEAGAGLANVMRTMTTASTSLGFAIKKTASGGTDLVGTLAGIEKKFGKVSDMPPATRAAFEKAFGGDFKTLAMILGQTDALSDSLGKIEQSAGSAADAQKALEATTAAQAQIAAQQLDALKIELAAGIGPALKELTPVAKSAISEFTGFAKEHPKIVGFVGTLLVLAVAAGSIAGPVLSALGAISSLAGTLGISSAATGLYASITEIGLIPALGAATAEAWAFAAAMLANPITWVVLAIVALAAVLYIWWDPISAFFIDIWNKVKKSFEGTWKAVLRLWEMVKVGAKIAIDYITFAWTRVVGFFTRALEEIRGAFKVSFVKGILTLLSYINPIAVLYRIWSALGPWLFQLWLDANAMMYRGIVAGAKGLLAYLGQLYGWVREGFNEGILVGLGRLWSVFSPVAWLYRWYNLLTTWLFGLSLKDAAVKVFSTLLDGFIAVGQTINGWHMAFWGALWDFFGEGIKNDLGSIPGFFSDAWHAVEAVLLAFNPLALISAAWMAVVQWLASFSLAEAGSNIVNTIVEGMKAAAGAPVEAMKGIVQDVRNLLPFSPAKEGPLRDLDKVKLVETVADTVSPAPLVDAMTGATGDAMKVIDSAAPSSPLLAPITMPTLAVEPPPARAIGPSSAGSNPGGGGGGNVWHVTLSIGAGADQAVVDQLKALLDDPAVAAKLHAVVQRVAGNDARKELG